MHSSKFFTITLITVTLLLISGNLLAQTFKYKWEFALEAGAGIRVLRIEPKYPSLENKEGVSFTGGLALQYNVTNTLAVKLGAAFEIKGADLERTDIQTKGKINIDYISVPLLLKARFGKNLKFFVNAGPYLGILMSSKTKLDAYSGNPEQEIDNDSTNKKIDFGISGGIGLEIPFGKNGAFTIELRDNFGMTNISESLELNAPEIKTHTANVMVGYVLKFGQKRK